MHCQSLFHISFLLSTFAILCTNAAPISTEYSSTLEPTKQLSKRVRNRFGLALHLRPPPRTSNGPRSTFTQVWVQFTQITPAEDAFPGAPNFRTTLGYMYNRAHTALDILRGNRYERGPGEVVPSTQDIGDTDYARVRITNAPGQNIPWEAVAQMAQFVQLDGVVPIESTWQATVFTGDRLQRLGTVQMYNGPPAADPPAPSDSINRYIQINTIDSIGGFSRACIGKPC